MSSELVGRTVAYLGPEASYTHQAAIRAFPSSTLIPYSTIVSVFQAVREAANSGTNGDHSTFGVIPIENSTNGPVAATLDQLTQSDTAQSLRIVGEVRVPIRHCLLGRKAGTRAPLDGSSTTLSAPHFGDGQLPDLSHIKQLHTHPQAWGQCTKFMKALGLSPPGPKPVATIATSNSDPQLNLSITCHDASSTSSAAALAAADTSSTTAAISSPLAASAYGADILLDGLEDSSTNVTRFLIIQPRSQALPGPLQHLQDAKVRKKALVTFMLTPTRDGSPGGLSDALGSFAKEQLSLTSINARPKGGEVAFEYTFIVEMDLDAVEGGDGDGDEGGMGSKALERALDGLQGVVVEVTCLGSWVWGFES